MLRLPPTLITISPVELQDFCLRQKARLLTGGPNISGGSKKQGPSQTARFTSENQVAENGARHEPPEFRHGNSSIEYVGDVIDSSHDVSHLPDEPTGGMDFHMQDAFEDLDTSPRHDEPTHSRTASHRSAVAGRNAVHTESYQEYYDVGGQEVEGRPCSDDGQSLDSDSSIGQENEPEFLPVSHDSAEDTKNYAGQRAQKRHQASSSPSKHRFDYGGFVETSSFVPDDISTPALPTQNDVQRLRARLPLPRSPLHISEVVAKSPERFDNPSTKDSSRNAPSGLLSEPPRRTPKAYRPRTISYSYDESERASAVYEEPQVNVSDNDDSQICNAQLGERVSLHEELRGSSLHSASEIGDVPSSPPGGVIVYSHEANRTIYFSSPQLPGDLPPSYSTLPPSTSLDDSIPSQDGYKSDDSGELIEHSPSPQRRTKAPQSSGQSNPRSTGPLHRIGRMFSGRYRERSPVSSPESSRAGTVSSPTTPRQSIENPRKSSQSGNTTPRHSMRVYDDSLPPSSQPQTPAHLPESRHRSRLHPSYTAPVTRHGRRAFPRSSARTPGSAGRIRRIGRSNSPAGMGNERGEGFRGLYGGQENIDDDELFDNAARRLWDTGRARSAERSEGTPERGLTIADIRRDYQ